VVRAVVTTAMPEDKVRAAESLVIARTGKATTISVRQVASQDELALLRQQMIAPPPPPPPDGLESMRKELISRLDSPLKESWPAELAPL